MKFLLEWFDAGDDFRVDPNAHLIGSGNKRRTWIGVGNVNHLPVRFIARKLLGENRIDLFLADADGDFVLGEMAIGKQPTHNRSDHYKQEEFFHDAKVWHVTAFLKRENSPLDSFTDAV